MAPEWLYPNNCNLNKLLNPPNELTSQHFPQNIQNWRHYNTEEGKAQLEAQSATSATFTIA